MADWITVHQESTINNTNIANTASEIFYATAEFQRKVRAGVVPGGYNSIEIVETAGASSITVELSSGNNTVTLVLPASSSIIVEPENGEYYNKITITNNSGAQYDANSAYINRAVKIKK